MRPNCFLLAQHLQGFFFQDAAVQGPGPLVEYITILVYEDCSGHAQDLIVIDHVCIRGKPSRVGRSQLRKQRFGIICVTQTSELAKVNS